MGSIGGWDVRRAVDRMREVEVEKNIITMDEDHVGKLT
jgi:hypothetical protein